MKRLTLLLAMLMVWSCKPLPVILPVPPEPKPRPDVYTDFTLSVRNVEGQDMLDVNTPNYLDPEATRILFVNEKGSVETYFDAASYNGLPYSYRVDKLNDVVLIKIIPCGLLPSATPNHFHCTNYIRWADKTEDLVECDILLSKDCLLMQTFTINGKLLWSADKDLELSRVFTKTIYDNQAPEFTFRH